MTHVDDAKGRSKRRDLRNVALFLLAAWLIGAAIFYFFYVAPWVAHQDWLTTAGKVIQVEIKPPPRGAADECPNSGTSGNELLLVAVTYTYEVDGTSYESDQFTYQYRGVVTCTRDEANADKANYERQKSITVHYDPDDSSRSVVELPDALVIFVFGPILALLLIGILGWYVSRRLRLRTALGVEDATRIG